jgi:cytochrome c oxidase subunit 1
VVVVFSLGGLTGLYLASTSMDIYLHDTYFVVGHFHLTMAASVLFGSFAAIYFWFPKMFGKQMNRALGVVHFVFSLLPVLAVFGIMMAIGFAGMQRRLYDPSVYEFLRHLKPLNDAITWGAYVLGLGQIPFVVNFFWSLARGRKAADNPWEVTTLEWQIPSPPPHYNYAEIPKVLHGPHEFSHPDVKDKDWLAQNETLPGTRGGEAAA